MNAQKQAKVAQIKEASEKLNASKALVIAEYAGLTVQNMQELRRELKAKGVEAKVYKNRLFKLALKDAGVQMDEYLEGPNLYVFGMEDDISPAKVLAEFAKTNEALKLKAGIFEGNVVDEAGVREIATLPSLEEALTMLATSLLAPVNQIGKGLQLLIDEDKLGAAPVADTPAPEAQPSVDTPAEEVKAEEPPAEEVKEDAAPSEEKTEEAAK